MNSYTKGFSQAQIKEVDLLSSLRRIYKIYGIFWN